MPQPHKFLSCYIPSAILAQIMGSATACSRVPTLPTLLYSTHSTVWSSLGCPLGCWRGVFSPQSLRAPKLLYVRGSSSQCPATIPLAFCGPFVYGTYSRVFYASKAARIFNKTPGGSAVKRFERDFSKRLFFFVPPLSPHLTVRPQAIGKRFSTPRGLRVSAWRVCGRVLCYTLPLYSILLYSRNSAPVPRAPRRLTESE